MARLRDRRTRQRGCRLIPLSQRQRPRMSKERHHPAGQPRHHPSTATITPAREAVLTAIQPTGMTPSSRTMSLRSCVVRSAPSTVARPRLAGEPEPCGQQVISPQRSLNAVELRPDADSLDPLTYEALRHRLWATTRRTGQALNRMPSSAVVTDRNDIAIAITDKIGGTDRPLCAVPRHSRLTWRPLDPGTSTRVDPAGRRVQFVPVSADWRDLLSSGK
jgi:hypothetical protein